MAVFILVTITASFVWFRYTHTDVMLLRRRRRRRMMVEHLV